MTFLEDEIKTLVLAEYPASQFILGSEFRASVDGYNADDTVFPLIILDNELDQDCEIATNANILCNTKIILTVLFKDTFDEGDEDSNLLVQSAKTILHRLFVRIYQFQRISPDRSSNKYRLTPIVRQLNFIGTGAAGMATFKDTNIVEWC